MTGARPQLCVRLLGGFECQLGSDAPLVVQSKKARGVLAYLALARGKSVARDPLARLFWPSSQGPQARQSLRQCLSALRKLTGDKEHDLIRSEGDQVSLAPERVDIDVDAVLQAAGSEDPADLLRGTAAVQGLLLPDHVFGEEAVEYGPGGGQRAVLRPDDSVHIVPKGLVHREVNTGTQPNRALVMRVGEGPAVVPQEGPAELATSEP